MMRVLSVVHYPMFGGPHNRNMRLAPVLRGLGVDTTVLLPDEPGNAAARLTESGVDVRTLPLTRIRASRQLRPHVQLLRNFPAEVSAIRKLIEHLRIDVVQLNGLVNSQAAFAARRAGVPVVWQILDTYTPTVLRTVLAPVVRRYADVVMCTGLRVADEHPGVVKTSDRLVNFFPPVDIDLFQASPAQKKEVRKALGVEDAALVVGTVGNINFQKGHDNFIRAAAALKKKVPGAKFLLLGSSHDNHGEYIDGLWRLAAELGLHLGEDLIVRDPTGHVQELVQAMDVFWMTPRPRSEGIPTAMEEAMALGLPVVSFDVGSICELVENDRTGYLVSTQDSNLVADITFDRLMDSEKRTSLGARGREFIEKNASLHACAKRHVSAYDLARSLHDNK